jgi:plasmid stabilization system protein ParE
MVIVRRREYLTALKVIISFISKDSKSRALAFQSQLDHKISNLVNFPYKFQQSQNHEDVNVRDMVFKRYTITYLVETEKNRISILDIYKWQER